MGRRIDESLNNTGCGNHKVSISIYVLALRRKKLRSMHQVIPYS